jgi:predicted transposase YbfD/YdcC
MAVKENQPKLHAAIAYWFAEPRRLRSVDHRQVQTVGKGHGRIERRVLTATTELNAYLSWPDVQQALMLEKSVVDTKTGEVSVVRRYAVTSLSAAHASPTRLLTLWRGHWSIENGLHYPRDVWFGEDASHIRAGFIPEVMAICRNAILSLLRVWGYASVKLARECFELNPAKALGLLELPVSVPLE